MSVNDISAYFSMPKKRLFGKSCLFEKLNDLQPRFFSSGRDCMALIAKQLGEKKTLHLPKFLCTSIKNFLANYYELRFYNDNPLEDCADFESIKLEKDKENIVLFCNYFGLKDRAKYDRWADQNKSAIIVEDHSHSPFSDWALSSNAHFSFASLRKVLPIADGAYIYSNKYNLPKLALLKSDSSPDFAYDIYRAMLLKDIAEKEIYVRLFLRGEKKLSNKCNIERMGDLSHAILAKLNLEKIFLDRFAFASSLKETLKSIKDFDVIIPKEANDCFMPILKFKDTLKREEVRKLLIENNVYPQVYWNFSKDAELEKIAEKLLMIPLDLNRNADISIKKISKLLLG